MFEVNERIHIPESEFTWRFVRSGGPGGQNVNKVASKAVLSWDVASSPSLPEDVKARLRTQQRRRFNAEGVLVVSSQRYRDQDRNRQDCLERLRDMVLEALQAPTPRRATRPTRGSKKRRLAEKRQRSQTKQRRQGPLEE